MFGLTGSRVCLLCFLHLFYLDLLAMVAQCRKVRRRRIRCLCRPYHPLLLPPSLHLFLPRHLQEGSQVRPSTPQYWIASCPCHEEHGSPPCRRPLCSDSLQRLHQWKRYHNCSCQRAHHQVKKSIDDHYYYYHHHCRLT